MKKYLTLIMLSFLSLQAFAYSDTQVCSQLYNLTGETLHYQINNKSYSVYDNEVSKVHVLPEGSIYQLRDGAITVYAGMPQVTEDGNFNFTYAFLEIGRRLDCDVFYLLYIYQ